ncbi:MAG: acetolactate decarboxylase [Thermodesulfovibrionales bacterium]|nr:acetolactate decarboxylase [Thermodesulfovibrionales bacterium]
MRKKTIPARASSGQARADTCRAMRKNLNVLLSFFFLSAVFLLSGCCHSANTRDTVFQTSTLEALMEGGYEGTFTFGELREHGDTGLGTFQDLDGEMVAIDGQFFQVRADGSVHTVMDSATTPFAVMTFFEAEKTFLLDSPMDRGEFEQYLNNLLPAENVIYTFRIEGDFSYIKTRSVPKQTKPYPPLKDVIRKQTIFEFRDSKGSIAGFRFPDVMKGLNSTGYHFHFLTEDRRAGGHVLEYTIKNAVISVDTDSAFFLLLPESKI